MDSFFHMDMTMAKHIIAVNGTIGSGKDTFSSVFVENGWQRMSFANALKDAVSCIFGWDREMLEGNTSTSRKWRETPDEYWSDVFQKPVTPRWVLQYFGTDIVRMHFLDDIWIHSLRRKIITCNDNVIITDCRFPNELRMVHSMGGKVVEVQRHLPEWYDEAVQMNLKIIDINAQEFSEKHNIHSSEFSWVGINDPDFLIHNVGTLDQLYTQAVEVLGTFK